MPRSVDAQARLFCSNRNESYTLPWLRSRFAGSFAVLRAGSDGLLRLLSYVVQAMPHFSRGLNTCGRVPDSDERETTHEKCGVAGTRYLLTRSRHGLLNEPAAISRADLSLDPHNSYMTPVP